MSSPCSTGLVWQGNKISFPKMHSVLSEATIWPRDHLLSMGHPTPSWTILLSRFGVCRMVHTHNYRRPDAVQTSCDGPTGKLIHSAFERCIRFWQRVQSGHATTFLIWKCPPGGLDNTHIRKRWPCGRIVLSDKSEYTVRKRIELAFTRCIHFFSVLL